MSETLLLLEIFSVWHICFANLVKTNIQAYETLNGVYKHEPFTSLHLMNKPEDKQVISSEPREMSDMAGLKLFANYFNIRRVFNIFVKLPSNTTYYKYN
jgi:hypothetical protein